MKRIFACLFITAVLLLVASQTRNSSASTVPFATVAYAGHTIGGSWCDCGTSDCTCDPGELGGSSRPLPNQTEKPSHQNASPIRERTRLDFGTGALMLALAFFVWTRLRA
jgi:hypothetical protein